MRKRRFHKRRGGPPRSPLYRVPAGRRTVRLGVAADERGPSGWLLRAVERAAGLPFVSLCAIVQLPGVQLPGVQLPGIRSPGIRSTGDEQGDDAGALDERVAAETLGVPVLCAERDARAIARDIDLLVVPDDLPLPQTLLGIRALEVWRISSRDARLPLDALFEACRLTEVRVEVLRPGEPEPVYRAVIRTDLSIRPGLYRRQARLAMLPALARAREAARRAAGRSL